MFGDTVESIREFDPDTQLSSANLNSVTILPYNEIISNHNDSIYNLLNNPDVLRLDSDLIDKSYKHLQEEIFEYKTKKQIDFNFQYMFNLEEINVDKYININNFGMENKKSFSLISESIENFNGKIDFLKEFVLSKIPDYTVVFFTSKLKLINEISDLFKNNVSVGKIIKNQINILNQNINEGFILNKTIYISDKDLEQTKSILKYKNTIKMGNKIKSFSDIAKGDYVVHYQHGIGIYGGVSTISKNGIKKDYILINYQGADKVYIPVEKINSIFKYSDKDGIKPKINKLGTSTWEKTKQAVQRKIKDISQDLINLYANRARLKTIPYLSFPEEIKFNDEFEYIETSDQLKCIEDIDNDLSSELPMDRLLCGDVGFGKTEVAFRGIFKTVMNGFQVVYLCPTTILSKQQYTNAKERFKSFNLNIALLNRFTTPKDSERILNELVSGKIDIVFGTHRLLNDKIKYNNLGLLIIDEEQRFGVIHKEKIKELKTNVNVLTLSATPIPRTLKMAMSGLKDLSIIDTAPQNRYPIQTYVLEENDLLIKEAIYKEISRKGQVYLLYNNVKKMESQLNKIQKLVPEAQICFAHGQMNKIELEEIIEDFIDYKYDVIICSTIIETGIDISNVNTLIIIDAQNYGLSQLYQLRGRVGRSDKIAYAYLMYNPVKTLTETAVKRLKAIKEFTELGSGYKIALRDLSIRGAGDLLGSEQAGFIESVGINLYTQMVQEVINEMKGKPIEYKDDSVSLLNVETHIPENYVSDENIRIEIHSLINQIKDFKSLKQIRTEIEDRFGKIDEKLEVYMYEEWFEKLSSKLKITQINQTNDKIEIYLPVDVSDRINGEKLFLQTYNINPNFKIKYQMKKIIITLPIKNQQKHYIYYLVDLLKEIDAQLV